MKYSKSVYTICLFIYGTIVSCAKNTETIEYVGNNQNLTQLNPVKKGEPFVIIPSLPDSNSSVRWTIKPSDGTELSPNGIGVNISIDLAGSYLITAQYYSPSNTTTPYDSSVYTILVNDSLYISPPPLGSGLDTVQLTGDQLVIVSVLAGGDSGLAIIAQTVKLYNCSPYLTAYGMGLYGPMPLSSLALFFNSGEVVEGKGNCQGVKNPAKSNITLIPPTNGTYTISANLNQVDYQGSLTVSDTAYTYTWPYTSGITISPLKIKK